MNGLFFIARAANLVKDPGGKAQITKFGHSQVREIPRLGGGLERTAGH